MGLKRASSSKANQCVVPSISDTTNRRAFDMIHKNRNKLSSKRKSAKNYNRRASGRDNAFENKKPQRAFSQLDYNI